MKFEILFRSSSNTYLRGLELLDVVRSVIVNVTPEEIHDSVYVEGDVIVEVGEEVARKSGHFQYQNKTRVAVVISKEHLKSLVVVDQVRKDSWSGLLVPVVGYDTEALLESWAAQGYPENMQYPAEPDPEEESEEI
jgi:hypothetical protein